MPSSAELPIFESEFTRRQFLRGSAQLGASGLIYSAMYPFLSECSQADSGESLVVASAAESTQSEIPERYFTLEWIRWKAEQELGKSDFLVGQIAEVRRDKQTQNQRVFISEILGGPSREVILPTELDINKGTVIIGPSSLAFSPDGGKLAIWARSGSGGATKEHIFVVDTQNLSVGKIHEGRGTTAAGLLRWSQDGKRLAFSSYPGELGAPPSMGTAHVFDLEDNKIVFSDERAIARDFSPDGKWLVVDKGYTTPDGRPISDIAPRPPYTVDMHLVNLGSGEVRKVFFQGNFVWSHDSRYLAATRWPIATTSRGGYFNYPGIDVLDSINRDEAFGDLPVGWDYPTPLLFSPDNGKVLFSATIPRQAEEALALLDIKTEKVHVLYQRPQPMLFGFGLSNPNLYSFLSPTELLTTEQNVSSGDIEVKIIDLTTGNIVPQYSIRPEGPLAGFGRFELKQAVYQIRKSGGVDLPGEVQFYSYSKSINRSALLGKAEDGDYLTNYTSSIEAVSDGEAVSVDNNAYIFANGRLYKSKTNDEEVPARTVLHRNIERISRSENKLDFGTGDILIGPGGRGWYLQNGGRYEIPGRAEDFVHSRHKNMKAYEVPSWVIDKIPVKEMPSRFFEDQHGRRIDGASPRLFLLSQGMGSESTKDLQVFSGMIAFLKSIGCRDEQILFGTCNVEVKRLGNSREITPRLHAKEHSTGPVNDSLIAMSYNLDWISEKAPTAQLALIGHSQAGFVGLRGALSHPQMVCQVVTIDSPHKGVDDVVLNFNGIDFDRIGFYFGQVGEDFVRLGESASFGEEVEGLARKVTNYGIDLFTFSNARDRIVSPDRAILRNATRGIGSYEVPLLWNGPERDGILPAHGWLLDNPQFLEVLVRLVGRP